jgi:LAO/AO transport system kinase
MLTLGERRDPGEWRPPVVSTVASRGEGLDELVESLEKHRGWLAETGNLRVRRRRRAGEEVAAIALGSVRDRMHGLPAGSRLDDLADAVVSGELDPYSAADRLVLGITRH